MEGYSLRLKKMVDIAVVQTIQLPDGSFVHRGLFRHEDGVAEVIQRKIYDHDIIVTKEGRYFPRDVFVGNKTPQNIQQLSAGQTVIKNLVVEEKITEEKVVTLDQLKRGKL